MYSNSDDFKNRNLFLTAKLSKFDFFSKFYHRHSELIVKYNIGLKTLLQQDISEPIFYDDLVYKFKIIVGNLIFKKKIIKRYKKVWYTCYLDIMRQSASLVVNTIIVYSYDFLFNCTTVGQASDSMMALTQGFNRWVGVCCLAVARLTVARIEVFLSSEYLRVVSPFFLS